MGLRPRQSIRVLLHNQKNQAAEARREQDSMSALGISIMTSRAEIIPESLQSY